MVGREEGLWQCGVEGSNLTMYLVVNDTSDSDIMHLRTWSLPYMCGPIEARHRALSHFESRCLSCICVSWKVAC